MNDSFSCDSRYIGESRSPGKMKQGRVVA